MTANIATMAYIAAIILFILSLGGLSNPETSRRGNLYGMLGMAIAVLATVFGPRVTLAGVPYIVGLIGLGRATALAVIAGYLVWTALWLGGNAAFFGAAGEAVGAGVPDTAAGPLAGTIALSVVCSVAAGLTAAAVRATKSSMASVPWIDSSPRQMPWATTAA